LSFEKNEKIFFEKNYLFNLFKLINLLIFTVSLQSKSLHVGCDTFVTPHWALTLGTTFSESEPECQSQM
jgi:hypothetical protein